MRLEIPADEQELLKKWLLDDKQPVERVLGALEQAEPFLRRAELAEDLAQRASLDDEEASNLVVAFINLAHTLNRQDDEDAKGEFRTTVFRVLAGDVAEVEKRTRFDELISRIAACSSIGVTGKAIRVALDNQNTFCRARTLSELRPVFVDHDGQPTIHATMIVHNLKLVYHTGPEGELEELFLTMDERAIEALHDVLERAKRKHESLKELAAKLETPCLSGTTHAT